jgi:site-specific recombinase XerD
MTLNKMIETYYDTVKDYHSKSTNEIYEYYRSKLLEVLNELKIKHEKQLTEQVAFKIVSYLKTKKLSNDTINRTLSHLKKILRFHHVNSSFHDFKYLKKHTNSFNRLYHEDLKLLIDYCRYMNFHKNSINYKTMVFLMLDSGIRLTELLNIRKANIDFHSDPMRIQLDVTKNGRKRYAPFSEFSYPFIKELFDAHDNSYLFWDMKQDSPFTKQAARSFFKATKEKLGFERLHAHMLRKTFASILIENGMDIYDLQKLLDHSRVSTTQLYTLTHQNKSLTAYMKYKGWHV